MATTFTIYITTKALSTGTFTSTPDLTSLLRKAYLSTLPPVSTNDGFTTKIVKPKPGPVRFISIYLNASYGNLLQTEYGDQQDTRYMRVVVDVPMGRYAKEEKAAFLRGCMEACVLSQGKKAKECEIEVKVNEVEEADVVRKEWRE